MKPRVARVISYLPVGGVEKRLLAVLKKLKGDFDVEVICIHSRGKLAPLFEEAGIPITVIPFKSRLHPVSLYRLASYLKKRRVDIVHTHMYRPNVSGVLAARLAGVPVVISNVHNVDHWDNRRQRWMDSLLHPFRDAIIAVSHAVKLDIVEKSRAPLERVVVLHNGVDLGEFQIADGALEEIREGLGISREAFVISIVARVVPRKGHKYLFRAAGELEEVLKIVKVLVVGDGFYRPELEMKAREMGLEGVSFLGERGDVPFLFKISHVSVLPSRKEGFPNVILESMAAGTPVVATDVGGAREVVEPGHTGFLIKPRDSKTLGELLELLLARPVLRESIGTKGKRVIGEQFSIERMAANTKELYLRLLGKSG